MQRQNTNHHPDGAPDQSRSPECATRTHTAILLAILWIIAAFPLASIARSVHDRPPQPTQDKLDPNDATWWQLTALPRIGESLARRMTRYRNEIGDHESTTRAFFRPDDLQRVRGIGPKTVARLAPFLRFTPQKLDSTRSTPDD